MVPGQERATNNGDGTKTDKLTGLMWESGRVPTLTKNSILEENTRLKYILLQRIQSLSEKRDWLDPDIEKVAKQII